MALTTPLPPRAAAGAATLWAAVLLWLLLAAAAAAAPPETGLVRRDGLLTARFALSEGTVQVHLPEDLVAGETVSGTVTVTVAGDTPRRRERAAQHLARLTLSVGGQTRPLTSSPFQGSSVCGTLRCVEDESSGEAAVPVLLNDPKGRPLAEVRLPLATEPARAGTDYLYRPVGVAGQSLEIRGVFDGDGATTRATVGGVPAETVAESPRHAFVAVPPSAMGPTWLELSEDGARYSGAFRSLAAQLSPGKPVLAAGERTTLRLSIHGLSQLDAEMPLQIVSLDPQTTLLESGAVQTLHVHPSEVLAGGSYLWIGTALGVTPGPVELTLSTQHSRPESRLEPEQ